VLADLMGCEKELGMGNLVESLGSPPKMDSAEWNVVEVESRGIWPKERHLTLSPICKFRPISKLRPPQLGIRRFFKEVGVAEAPWHARLLNEPKQRSDTSWLARQHFLNFRVRYGPNGF